MGRYNPDIPHILGQEWVPIRDEDVEFSPNLTTVEIGHSFSTEGAATIGTGRYYVHSLEQSGLADLQFYGINIYPKGNEAETGPVKRVLIPCNAAGVTGDTGSGAVTAAADWPLAVFNPSDNNGASAYVGGVQACMVRLFFGVNNYIQALSGKRILAVNYLQSFDASGFDLPTLPAWTQTLFISVRKEPNTNLLTLGTIDQFGVSTFPFDTTLAVPSTVHRLGIGAFSRFAGFAAGNQNPWNFAELQRFESTHSNRMAIQYSSTADATHQAAYGVGYAALEVFYCEENRVACGISSNATGIFFGENINTNLMNLVNPITNAAVNLPGGDWTITVGAVDAGTQADLFPLPAIPLNGSRQLYPLRTHPGVIVTHPFPLDESAVGQTLTKKETQVLPQISLHTDSGGPFDEVHVYGRQAVAWVCGNITAQQTIYDVGAGGPFSYPYARFYARHWGATVPLKISSTAPTVSGSFAYITPDQFDALPPSGGIIDGWKEVTLQFPAATTPSMGSGFSPRWIFSAASESTNTRWEVLGAVAPALSGVPLNEWQQWPTVGERLTSATYGAPISGSNANLSWVPGFAPMVSATTADPMSDAALMFSQYPPSITGLTITNQTQAISGVGLDCGGVPCCIPTGITYHELTWSPPFPIVCDQFSRVVANGWGSISPGLTWSITGGVAGDFSVNGSAGLITPSTAANRYVSLSGTGTSLINYDTKVQVSLSSIAGSTNHQISVLGRFTDANNFYRHRVFINSAGEVSLFFDAMIAGVNTATTGPQIDLLLTDPNPAAFFIRAQADGTFFRTKVWLTTDTEPADWHMIASNATLTTGTVGVSTVITTATITFDNFNSVPLGLVGSTYELQRMDTVTSTWQTVMLASNLCTSRFRDFEARVGVPNSYRIRTVNRLNFVGQWSPTVSGSITGPGITGSPCLNSASGVLIFTSNYDQTGLYNLAYVPVWEGGTPSEDFSFPEASTLTYGRMYNRNFQVGFKPSERGGEVFQRQILVQAAAVAIPRLANVRSLRDMAWQNAPYICVRDDIGDRWFAGVQVPTDNVRRNRRLYMANITVTEVTDTPYPVNP